MFHGAWMQSPAECPCFSFLTVTVTTARGYCFLRSKSRVPLFQEVIPKCQQPSPLAATRGSFSVPPSLLLFTPGVGTLGEGSSCLLHPGGREVLTLPSSGSGLGGRSTSEGTGTIPSSNSAGGRVYVASRGVAYLGRRCQYVVGVEGIGNLDKGPKDGSGCRSRNVGYSLPERR